MILSLSSVLFIGFKWSISCHRCILELFLKYFTKLTAINAIETANADKPQEVKNDLIKLDIHNEMHKKKKLINWKLKINRIIN